ncbi:MAG: peroxiredoxin [Methylomonas sp.]|jgi:peroxiredoxin Q/BCP
MKTPHTGLKYLALFLPCLTFVNPARAADLKIGESAPLFQLTAQDGSQFELASRQGVGWTVLYFYPKAGTPGCTTQACAFRDAIQAIRQQNAEVYGVSTDEVKDLQDFHQKHKLNFTLLSDPNAEVTEAYGVKMPVLQMAKRWTFIVDPALIVRQIDDDVDPALDAQKVAESLKKLKAAALEK